MEFKPSYYNFFFDTEKGEHLAFNAVTGSLVEVEQEKTFDYLKGLTVDDAVDWAQLEESEEWKKQGFFVENDLNELQRIKIQYDFVKYNPDPLNLTIMLTEQCNMKCPYCFEKRLIGKMSPEVEQGLVRFVETRLTQTSKLLVTWYGGEPLLEKEVIRRLSDAFIELCRKRGVAYEGGIVTNGVLLTEETIDMLVSKGVSDYQITIDGPAETHNTRRVLRNGKPSFDTIIANLKNLIKTGKSIVIRINTDYTNKDQVPKLIQYFKENGILDQPNVHPYLAAVVPYTDACKQTEECTMVADPKQAQDLMDRCIQAGLRYRERLGPKYVVCGGQRINTFLIAPNGDIYKCTNLIGEAKGVIGNVTREKDPQLSVPYVKWLGWDPFSDEKCRACKLLPQCYGNCPYVGFGYSAGEIKRCYSSGEEMLWGLRTYYKHAIIKTRTTI